MPQLHLDYWFVGGQGETGRENLPVLVMFEQVREVLFAHRVDQKGSNQTALRQLCADLDAMGIKRTIYKSDQEPSIRSLLSTLQVEWKGELVPESSPKGDKDSNGSAGNAVKQNEGLTRTY